MGAPNLFKQTPGRALLAFAITAALVAVFSVVDARRRAQLEGYDFPTALGDADFFDFGERFDPSAAVLEFRQKPIFQRRRKALDRYDMYMIKVGRDDGDHCYLYHYEKPRSGMRTPDGIYWVKVGDGSYIEVGETPRSADEAEETDEEGAPQIPQKGAGGEPASER